jgi:hypothetical protein
MPPVRCLRNRIRYTLPVISLARLLNQPVDFDRRYVENHPGHMWGCGNAQDLAVEVAVSRPAKLRGAENPDPIQMPSDYTKVGRPTSTVLG